MKSWNAIVAASGLDIPTADIDRIAKPLQALEETFRPLAARLTIADEPATIFSVEEAAE
jgi:hypothetical protein